MSYRYFLFLFLWETTHTPSIKNTRTCRYGNVETSRGYNSERYFRETYNRVTFCERSLLVLRTYHGRYGGACTFSFCNHISPQTRTPHAHQHTHRYVYSGVPRIHHEMCWCVRRQSINRTRVRFSRVRRGIFVLSWNRISWVHWERNGSDGPLWSV